MLDQYGGWTNELMVDWFVDYARIVFRELGPHVQFFTTINDPAGLCRVLYDYKNQSFGEFFINPSPLCLTAFF